MNRAYDEERAFCLYFPQFHGELLTVSERRHLRDAFLARTIHVHESEAMQKALRRQMCNPTIADLDETALDALELAICREADERAGGVDLHRCGRCNAILKTPLAQQCLYCGLDWHGQGPGAS